MAELNNFHQYLLRPTAVRVQLLLNRAAKGTEANTSISVVVEKMLLDVTQDAYNAALGVVTHLSAYQNQIQVVAESSNAESATSVLTAHAALVGRDPQALWRYASCAVLQKVQLNHKNWSWASYLDRKRQRTEYVNLRRKVLRGADLTDTQTARIQQLEKDISYNDLITYRKLASASVQTLAPLPFLDKIGPKGRGALVGGAVALIFLMLWLLLGLPISLAILTAAAGGAYFKKSIALDWLNKKVLLDDLSGEMQTWKTLFRLIAFDPEELPKPTAPPEAVQFGAAVAIENFGVKLLTETKEILNVGLETFNFDLKNRCSSMTLTAALRKIFVSERPGRTPILSPSLHDKESAVFKVQFDQGPLDRPGIDMFVAIKSQPIALCVTMPTLLALGAFFTPLSNAREVKEVARQSAASALATARAQVKYAILNRKTIELDIALNAPCIEIPQKQSESSTGDDSLYVHLGRLDVNSKPERMQSQDAHAKSSNSMERFLYDRYNISLTSVYAFIASTTEWAPDAAETVARKSQLLIRHFNVSLATDICTIPAAELPSIKLFGDVSRIKLCVSKDKIASLLSIVNNMTAPAASSSTKSAKKLKKSREGSSSSAPKAMRASRALLTGPAKKAARLELEQSQAREQAVHIPKIELLHATFQLQALSVVLSGRDLKRDDSARLRNIAAIEMRQAKLFMKQTNKNLVVNVEMQALLAKDARISARLKRKDSRRSVHASDSAQVEPATATSSPALYMIQSMEGEDLISLKYMMVPKVSSEYAGVGNDVQFDIGSLCFTLNRSALAYILLHVNDITSVLQPPIEASAASDVPEIQLPQEAHSASLESTDDQNDSLARVSANIKELKVNLIKSEEILSSFSLPASRVSVSIRMDGAMTVEGRLGALLVSQPASNAPLWRNILSVVGSDRAVKFMYQTYKPRDRAGVDMSVDLNLSSMEFVYLQSWVLEVSQYFVALGAMLAAKPSAQSPQSPRTAAAAKGASSQSQASASDLALDPWIGKALRLRLNVKVGQPIVVVPLASSKEEHLRMALGDIFVANEIAARSQELVDAMQVTISGMNLRLVARRGSEEILTVLRETGVNMKLVRLLYHVPEVPQSCPSIDIEVLLQPIILDIDKRQLFGVFGMLGGNMKESPGEDKELRRWQKDFAPPAAPSVAASISQDAVAAIAKMTTHVFDALRVQVRAARFELNMDALDNSDHARPLLQLSLNQMETHFSQKSDGQMKVNLQLDSIELTDMVVPSFTFRQVIAKVHDSKASKLFTVLYVVNPKTAETQIEVKWFNLTIVALPLTIVRFKKEFMGHLMDSLALLQGPVSADKAAPPSVSVPIQQLPASPVSAKMAVQLVLVNPCILLVQDSGSRMSDALVLDMGESTVKFESESGAQTHTRIATNVKNFRFHKIADLDSALAANLDSKRKIDILQPLELRVIMRMEGGGISGVPAVSNIGVETDSIDTIISYRDLQLFTKMNEAYRPAIEAFTAPAPTLTHSDSKDDLSSSESDDSNSEGKAVVSPPPATTTKLKCSIRMLQFGMINDRFAGDYFVPLLRSSVSALVVSATMGDGSTSAAVDTNGISAHSYNRGLAGWEPIIEPWEVAIGFMQNPKTGQNIHITSIKDSVLNLNLTRTMVDSVFGILDIVSPPQQEQPGKRSNSHDRLRSVRDLQQKKAMRNIDESATIHPYILKNDTGLVMEYWLASLNQDTPSTLKPGTSVPLAMTGFSRREIMTENFSHSLQVRLILPASKEKSSLCNVAIAKVGVSLHPISSMSDAILVCDVFEQPNGSKDVTFRGDYSITNNTDETVLLLASADALAKAAAPSLGSSTEAVETVELKPRARYSVDLGRSAFKILRFKPKGAFEWSEPLNLAQVKEDEQIPIHCRSLKGNAVDSSSTWSRDWYTFAYCDVERGLDHSVTLFSPLVVENMLPSPADFRISHSKYTQGASHEMTLAETDADHIHFMHSLDDRVQLSVRVPGYDWSEPQSILDDFLKRDGSSTESQKEPTGTSKTFKFHLHDSMKRVLRVSADVSRLNSRTGFRVVLYVRYWIANCTGLRLQFKSEAGDKHCIAGQSLEEGDAKALGENQLSWYSSSVLKPSEEISPRNHSSQAPSPYLYYGGSSLSMAVENSNFSKAYKLGATNQGTIQIKDEKTGRRYVFFINVAPAGGRFWRSAVVKILPCFVLANFTGRPVEWRQVNVPNSVQRLEIDYQMPLHWPSHKQPREIQVRYVGGPTWSNQFLPTVVGRFPIKIRNNPLSLHEDPGKSYDFISLHIRDNPGSATFIALENQPEKSFIQVKNRSNVPLVVRELGDHLDLSDIHAGQRLKKKLKSVMDETGVSSPSGKVEKPPSAKIVLEPHATVSYSWTDPQAPDPEIMITSGTESISDDDFDKVVISLTKIKEFKSMRLGPHNYLRFSMKVSGQAKTLVIRQSRHARKDEDESGGSSRASSKDAPAEKVAMKFNLELKGIGVSIVDDNPQEVMYMSMADLLFKYTLSDVQQSIELKIGSFQTDNDLYLTPCPVVLSSDPVPDHPFLHVVLVRDPKYTDFFCYRYFAVAMQKLNVEADEAFIVFALAWSSNIMGHLAKRSQFEIEERLLLGVDLRGGLPPRISQEELESPDAYYFELFQINTMEIDLTFSPTRNFEVPSNLDSGAAELMVTVAPYLSPVEEAPIKLSGMLLRHAFAGRTEFMQNITSHYTRQFLSQVFKILGSAEWLGNPTSLVSGLGSGVYTFFNEPANALVHSPDQLGISVAKGTKALLQGTLKGTLNMAGKLVGNVGKLGALLTMDDDYKREREIMKHKKARHVGEGLGYGLKEFGTGLVKGITGVVTQPVKGAKEEGLKGFGKGLGKGLLGVVLKPTVGAVDLVTRSVEGIKNTGSDVIVHKRVRLPRFFPEDRILIEYDGVKAEGQNLLRTLENGAFRRQYYVYHAHVGKGQKSCVLVSNNRIFLLDKNKILGDKLDLASPYDIEWAPRLRDLTFGVEADVSKLRVILRPSGDPSTWTPDSKLDSPILSIKGSPLASLSKKNKSQYVIPCATVDEVNLIAAKASGYIRGTDSSVTATKQIKVHRKKVEKELKKQIAEGGAAPAPDTSVNVVVAAGISGGIPGMGLGGGVLSPRTQRRLSRTMSSPPEFTEGHEPVSEPRAPEEPSPPSDHKHLTKAVSYTAHDAEKKKKKHDDDDDDTPSKDKKKKRHSVQLGAPVSGASAETVSSPQRLSALSVIGATSSMDPETPTKSAHKRKKSADAPVDDIGSSSKGLSPSKSTAAAPPSPRARESVVEIYEGGLFGSKWKKRFLVIADKEISVYKEQDKKKLRDRVSLASCQVKVEGDERSFSVSSASLKNGLLVRVPSNRDGWVADLVGSGAVPV